MKCDFCKKKKTKKEMSDSSLTLEAGDDSRTLCECKDCFKKRMAEYKKRAKKKKLTPNQKLIRSLKMERTKYYNAFNYCMEYFDELSDESKRQLDKDLKRYGL